MRNTPSTGNPRGGFDLTVESGSITRWKKALTSGSDLAVTQGRGTCLSVEGERGRDAGAGGGNWAAACCAGWAEGKTGEGKIWAFGPISREREEEKSKFLFFYLFKTYFKFILKSI